MNEAPNTKVLVGCETSGVVRQAFLDLGFDAWSCDILPSDQPSNRHIQDDVRNVLKMDSWDLVFIGHPPCTRLCNSGVRWLHTPPPNKTHKQMWRELEEGCQLFSDLWNYSTPCLAIENPVMHRHAKLRIKNFEKHSQSVQPWEFATSDDSPDNVKKRTCFWLRNLPTLEKTGTVDGSTARSEVHNAPPSKDRWKIRSKFYPELAAAMAAQWGLSAILNRRQAA
tara:strand:+ start:315 stop:986 length:672 start_codon:yes stop_codon:yes gene_type:complete